MLEEVLWRNAEAGGRVAESTVEGTLQFFFFLTLQF